MTVPTPRQPIHRRAWSTLRSVALRLLPFALVAWLGVSTGGGFPR